MSPSHTICLPATLAVVLVAGAGCGQERAQVHGTEAQPRQAPRTAGTTLVKRSRPMMGTIFQISVADVPEARAEPIIRAAMQEISRLEDLLSEWREGSEISRINRNAGGSPVHVSEETFAVVRAGVEVSRWSEGAFDLSWAALRGLYDFRPGHTRVPSPREVRPRLTLVRWEDIVLDEAARTVLLRRSGMAIGTGAIAKGYALDRAGAILEAAGLDSYMLFGGGQVQVHGMRGNRPWRVGIQHPRQPDYFAFLEATSGSISTSGDYERFFIDADGRRWHHILNPDTGMPATGLLSVTVTSPDGLHGDALSTACFVLGETGCLAMLARIPGGAEAVLVDSNFRLITTPGTADRLRFHMAVENGQLPH